MICEDQSGLLSWFCQSNMDVSRKSAVSEDFCGSLEITLLSSPPSQAAQAMVAMTFGPPQVTANVPATVVKPTPPNQMPAIIAAGDWAAA